MNELRILLADTTNIATRLHFTPVKPIMKKNVLLKKLNMFLKKLAERKQILLDFIHKQLVTIINCFCFYNGCILTQNQNFKVLQEFLEPENFEK